MNKDFYNRLPSCICAMLDDNIIPNYKNEIWFNEAWEKYRQHVLTTSINEMKMPWHVFNKYINKEEENN